jgi:ubiquinone/menaquinone biosynthesis C-methylase UbiE
LKNVNVCTKKRILNLGINSGDEFEVIEKLCQNHSEIEFVGIDISSSAIEEAKKRFPTQNYKFFSHDINKLDELALGKFDLIITIGTLQSSGVEFKLLFNSLVQNYLAKRGCYDTRISKL